MLFGWDRGCGEVSVWQGVVAAEDDGFVDCEEFLDLAAIAAEDDIGVGYEIWDDFLGKPASVEVLEIEREIPWHLMLAVDIGIE